MRITQRILNDNMLYALQRNLANIAQHQEKIERGTKINRPSDDPTGFSQTLALQSNLNLNYQYQRNIVNGLAWLKQTDVSLQAVVESLSITRERDIQAANDTNNKEDRAAIALGVDAMLDRLVVLANTSLGNTYIFGGLKNNFPPFYRYGDNVVFVGDNKAVLRDISPEGRYEVNTSGITSFYEKLTNLLRGPGSTVDTVSITSEHNFVKSFGAVTDAGLAASPLHGKMVLNLDGREFEVLFTGENTVTAALDKINGVLGLNGRAFIDGGNNLVIESHSVNIHPFVNVVSMDNRLSGLKLLAGFNNLQFGRYQVSTVNNASPGNSIALLTDSYSQNRSTIVTNIGVVDPNNQFNSSVLMEIVEVNYTGKTAEIVSTSTMSVNPGDIANGSTLELDIDGSSHTIVFNGVTSNADVVNQINTALGTFDRAYLDAHGNLVIRSKVEDSSSKIAVKALSADVAAALNMTAGQSGAVGVVDATVRFTYHTYDKDGNRFDGTFTQTFTDTDPKDGVPNSPTFVTVGDGMGVHDIDLLLNLTGFIQAGDKAVISITAESALGDAAINIGYDATPRRYTFNPGAADNDAQMRFFSLDLGNGEIYNGNIDLTFKGGISDSYEAVSFTAGNVFDCMVYIRKKIENEEQARIEQMQHYLDEMTTHFLSETVKVGARTVQFEAVNVNYLFLEVNLTKMLEDYYFTDPYKTIMKLEESMALFKSSLYSTSLISQTKLLDFLR